MESCEDCGESLFDNSSSCPKCKSNNTRNYCRNCGALLGHKHYNLTGSIKRAAFAFSIMCLRYIKTVWLVFFVPGAFFKEQHAFSGELIKTSFPLSGLWQKLPKEPQTTLGPAAILVPTLGLWAALVLTQTLNVSDVFYILYQHQEFKHILLNGLGLKNVFYYVQLFFIDHFAFDFFLYLDYVKSVHRKAEGYNQQADGIYNIQLRYLYRHLFYYLRPH